MIGRIEVSPFWTLFVLFVNPSFTLALPPSRAQSGTMPLSPLTRLRWRRRLRSFAALLLVAGLGWAAWVWMPPAVIAVPLVHVIDGDSLTVRQGADTIAIRLTGLDAVEYRQDCERPDGTRWPCGRAARTALETLAGHGPLHCEFAAKDRYHRTLAACRTRPFPDGVELGAEMVRQGWAVATSDAYLPEEGEAQAKGRGIWQGRFARPTDWRAANERAKGAMTPPDA